MEHKTEFITHEAFQKHLIEENRRFELLDQKNDKIEEERRKRHEEVMSKLEPLAETFRAASTMGKWIMAFLVFVSILIGILIGIKQLWKP
jgi:hypothetical protein